MPENHKVTTIFDRSYAILNDQQKKAVDTIEGPVMVIAGPGTGKTTILTLRIANILQKTDTTPDSILALTFTDSGSQSMRKKLLDTIGPVAYHVSIHTFHGFAGYIIEKYSDYFPRIIGSRIVTETEQITIIEKSLNSKKIKVLKPYGDPTYYVDHILREIHTLKRENISPAIFIKSLKNPKVSSSEISRTQQEKLDKALIKNKELAHIYEHYEKEMVEGGFYDFDDMLLELIRAMETDPMFKLMLQEQYQYVLADEHQDANASQNRILELLTDFHDMPNLFIVGDDKQAIYRFQGASLENFLYFSQKYPQASIIHLEHNYRSHQKILDVSHDLICHNPSIPGQELTRLRSLMMGGGELRLVEFATIDDELEGIAATISALVSAGETPEEIAVLYRDNRHAEAISKTLEDHGIVHRIESDHDIMADYDVVKILILCRAIFDPSNDYHLSSALLLPEMKIDSAEVAKLYREASRCKKPLYRMITSSLDSETEDIKKAYTQIIRWSQEAPLIPFVTFLQKLIKEIDMMSSIVTAPNSLERFYSLQALFDQVYSMSRSVKNFYLSDFIQTITINEKHGVTIKRGYSEYLKGVRLMTAHRAKGLEFNHVFIVHVVDGVWGNRSLRNYFTIPFLEQSRITGCIEDERRLFYVALTRARQSVMITRARSDGTKDLLPSQFISEINDDLLQLDVVGPQNINEKMNRIAKKPEIKNSVSILQPDFIKSLFTNQPLSVTHLNNYLECPWKYFFVNLIRIPEVENKHQFYGTAIHATLRYFFDQYAKSKDIPLKKLLQVFKNNLEDLPFSVDDLEESWLKGKRSLEGYYTAYKGTWNRNLLTEYSIRCPFVVDRKLTLELVGKLDKIEFINNREIGVVDYKTSKPKSRNEIEGKTKSSQNQGNYFRQLAFYGLLLMKEGKYIMRYGEIDFIEANERGKYKKEQFEIKDTDISKVKEDIVSMAQDILSLSFIASKCKDKKCSYCRLGRLLTTK